MFAARPRAVLTVVAPLLVVLTCPHAEASDHKRTPDGERADHTILGLKGVTTVEQATTNGHRIGLAGFGVAGVAERTLLHDRLSLELDVVYVAPGAERSIAIEPMTKLPWHLTRDLEPYAAIGPVVLSIADGHGAHYWLGGGQLVFGSLVWFAELMGLDLDVAFGAAAGTGMTVFEASFAIGPVLRN